MDKLTGRRVLIVEDEILVALNLEGELEMAGAAVVGPAHTLAEAMAIADAPMDAAVLDINLGHEQVWPLATRLRERGVPFVFASANCGVPGTERDRFAEIRCVEKPIDFRVLVAALAALTAS